jgi:hypothetical protein
LRTKAFDELLLEAIDEALASLGDSVRQAIYFHLENKFKIAKKEIPYHLEDFAGGLEKIFGLGARFLEILIMKNLYGKIGQPLEWNESRELSFVEYVTAARQSFLRSKGEAKAVKV